jgi:probable HAF family extracellular repeat protein
VNSRPLACIVAFAALSILQGSARGSLPIFGGMTFNTATDTGYFNATISASPQSCITNSGFAIGEATFHTPTVSDAGQRPLHWSTLGSASFVTGPDPASGIKPGHANGINATGITVGDSDAYAANGNWLGTRALRWTSGGGLSLLNDLGLTSGGYGVVRALGINTAGISVGSSTKYVADDYRGVRGVRWEAGTIARTELSVLSVNLAGVGDAEANDINDTGVVVGTSDRWDNTNNTFLGKRAVRWTNAGVITELGTLGTAANGTANFTAIGINNAGVTVANGTKYNASHAPLGARGVRYLANGTNALELGTLGTAADGTATAVVRGISNAGLTVGWSTDYFGSVSIGSRAVYWPANSLAATALPTLGVDGNSSTFARANSSNGDGAVVGMSDKYAAGQFQGRVAVLWTTAGTDAVLDLNTLLPANSGWTLSEAVGISNTGFVSGTGYYTPNGANSYIRHFSMLVPQAGTYGRGDGTLDGSIDFADLVLLAQHYNLVNASKAIDVADFNLDGVVNFADLVILAQNYNTSVPNIVALGDTSFSADWALAQSLVPEPSTLVAGMLIVRAVRRQQR